MTKQNKLIFIVSYGRSGTTLLNKVLSAHSDIHFINLEFNDLPFFYNNKKNYEKKYKNKAYEIMSKDFFSHPQINLPTTKIQAQNFKEFINGLFEYYKKESGKQIIGIKAANCIPENIKMIKEIFNDAYVIQIIRDVRDVLVSFRKTDFGVLAPKSAFYFGKSWKEIITQIKQMKKEIKHYHELKYESLVNFPEKETKKLCSFLEIPFQKDMLNFNEKVTGHIPEHHKRLKEGFIKNNFEKWKKELTKEELRLICASAGKLMYNQGYLKNDPKLKIKPIERLKEFIIDKSFYYYNILKMSKSDLKRRKYMKYLKTNRTN